MKKVLKKAAVLGAACAAVVALAPAASASEPPAAGRTCQFVNEVGKVVAGAYLYVDNVSVGVAAVCRDDSYNYWGYVGFVEKLTVSQWGQATLYRHRDGAPSGTVTCDSNGGNGRVMPNQRVCWTPKVSGLSGHYSFLAMGEMYSSHTGKLLVIGTTGEFAR
ncbi:hypothetical protein [Amycolatopsis sp. CA-128772]|uniref:hypothetical protein n=1 Tax=Amycolatopsis sp. CA-128772 TaxID=2073159 RepID=UPI000CD121E1|nr:hypothetical protein [Amycolatopsis sp. CA-128772]